MTRDIATINAIFQIWPLWIVFGFCIFQAVRTIDPHHPRQPGNEAGSK